MDSNKIVKLLNSNILPKELNFSIEQPDIDWSKVQYNSFYKSFEFHKSKYPEGFENIPGFDKIIINECHNAKTPLEEITKRQEEKNVEYLYKEDEFEFSGCFE
jgi:hypothetical protein